jgi:hypothetical protein
MQKFVLMKTGVEKIGIATIVAKTVIVKDPAYTTTPVGSSPMPGSG